MEYRGREIKFLRTIQATCEIADECPEGEISKVGSLFTGSTHYVTRNMAMLIHVLNKGYEERKAFDEEGYKPNVISINELMLMDDNDKFNELFAEAAAAFYKETPTVEVEPPKKNKKAKAETLD